MLMLVTVLSASLASSAAAANRCPGVTPSAVTTSATPCSVRRESCGGAARILALRGGGDSEETGHESLTSHSDVAGLQLGGVSAGKCVLHAFQYVITIHNLTQDAAMPTRR